MSNLGLLTSLSAAGMVRCRDLSVSASFRHDRAVETNETREDLCRTWLLSLPNQQILASDRPRSRLGGPSWARAGHRASKPLAAKACLTAGEIKNAINAFAASTCLLPELIPATYTE